MKRSNPFNQETVFPLAALSDDPLQLVLVFAHHQNPTLPVVCKKWRLLLSSYTDWYSIFYENYLVFRERASASDIDVFIKGRLTEILTLIESSPICQRLSQENDCKYKAFLNYLGRFFDTTFCVTRERRTDLYTLLVSIYLYLKASIENVLNLRHFHPRDFNLNFYEASHTYQLSLRSKKSGNVTLYQTTKIDDNELPTKEVIDSNYREYRLCSVTTFIHSLFPTFDENEVIDKMMLAKKWNNPIENAYYGMTKEEIIAQWSVIRTQASKDGTAMHANLEMYYSERPYKEDSIEFKLFKEYEKAHVIGKLRPYRTEWTIYSVSLELCGSVDILYEYVNEPKTTDGKKHLVLRDWKRSKKITMYNSYQSGSKPCTEHVGDANFIHYTIQLALYKYMLEESYDVVIDSMALVILHPNQKEPLFIPIDAELCRPLIEGVIQHRLTYLNQARQQCLI